MRNDELATLIKGFRPTFLGFGLFWAWVFLCFDLVNFSHWSIAGIGSTLWAHLFSLIATIPIYLLATFAYRPICRILNSRLACVALMVFLILGTLIYALPLFAGQPGLQLLGAAFTGLSSPFLLLLWSEQFGRLEARPIVVYTAFSFMLAELLYLGISLLPVIFAAAAAALCPLISLTMLWVHRQLMEKAGADTTQRTPRSFSLQELRRMLQPRLLFGFLSVMFIYGGSLAFQNSFGGDSSSRLILNAIPLLLVALIALGYVLFTSKADLNLGIGFRLSLLLIAAVFIPLALLGSSFSLLAFFFASFGVYAIEILTWILLASMASNSTMPRFVVFAACTAVFHVGMASGEITGILLVDHVLVFSILAICALVALAGFAFTDRDTTIQLEPPSPSELGQMAVRVGLLQACIERIADDFGLSEREREVFLLWATGYGVRAIEERLVIAASTVKTHIQHIYEKCDVHNRNEIIALLERYSETR
ncbi:MAG: LuxR C-terminal-related transcriptional regulator [Coriobacteriales bacterium]|jgi:DNA-binding CsgD family transcriptional regulator|nr:LuxR C-terminal-related transcriptional regulator [Coriobacteriales bacterium]